MIDIKDIEIRKLLSNEAHYSEFLGILTVVSELAWNTLVANRFVLKTNALDKHEAIRRKIWDYCYGDVAKRLSDVLSSIPDSAERAELTKILILLLYPKDVEKEIREKE